MVDAFEKKKWEGKKKKKHAVAAYIAVYESLASAKVPGELCLI